MVKFFRFLLSFMRQRGPLIADGEFRMLWIAIALTYVAITFEILGGVLLISLRRSWRRATAEPPRRTAKRRSGT